MILATMFFSRGVLNGKKKLFENQLSTVGTIRAGGKIRSGYLTPAVSGIPTASERGAKSEVAHKWAKWLPHPCRIGDPHRLRAGGKIRSGPQVGKVAFFY